MPKKNQIAGLSERILADGTVHYHWKASPRLRREGWTNLALGSDRKLAVLAAMARNDEVDAWQQRSGTPLVDERRTRARWTFRDLVDAYKLDPAFTGLKPKTRDEYSSRLRALTRWADDGRVLVRHIDRDMCIDLRNTLVAAPASSAYRTAAILRVLRVVMGFAVSQHVLPVNPAAELAVPEPPKRKHRLTVEQLPGLLAAAGRLGLRHVELGVVLGFYTMQREGDLLATTAFRFRSIDYDISGEARRALAGPDGRVLGLFLEQEKTETPVGVPLIPTSRAAIEAAMAHARDVKSVSAFLFQKDGQPVRDWTLQRDFRKACVAAADQALADADKANDPDTRDQLAQLADTYRKLQFRDLRRSGMCWMRELGVPVAMIASISGHSIEKTMKILDTYMPRDVRAAAEGMAIAVTRQAERDAAAKLEETK